MLRRQVVDLGNLHDRDQKILASLMKTGSSDAGKLSAPISSGITYGINFDLFFQALGLPPSSGNEATSSEAIEAIRKYLKQHGAKLDPADGIFLNLRLKQINVQTAFTNRAAIDSALSEFYSDQ